MKFTKVCTVLIIGIFALTNGQPFNDDHSVASTVTTPAREVTIPAQNASVVPESSKSLNKKSNDSIIEVSSEASTNPSNNSSEPASNAPSASKNVAPLDCLLFASGFVLAFHIFQ